MFILFIKRNEQPNCDFAILRFCDDINQLIVTQHFNHVTITIAIFSLCSTHILSYITCRILLLH